jgi:flagellar biogenesis protein FliO
VIPVVALLQAPNGAGAIGSVESEALRYIWVIFILALVVGLAYVVLRKGLPRMAGVGKGQSGLIGIAASYTLEPRKNLYVIQVGPDYYLVGTTEAGMHYLTALDAAHVEEARSHSEKAGGGELSAFRKAFQRTKFAGGEKV